MPTRPLLTPKPAHWALRYAIAALAVAGAVLLRLLVSPWADGGYPLATIFAAVGIAVWYGGVGPAVFAAVAGYGAANYLFIAPVGAITLAEAREIIGLAAYLFSCGVIIVLAQATRSAEQKFRLSQDAALQGYSILSAVTDRQGRVVDFRWTYVNPAGARMLGQTPEELIGARLLDVLPEQEGRPGLFSTMLKVMETGVPLDVEVRYDFQDLEAWFRNMVVKVDHGVAASFTDITARKRLEQALEQQAEELRQVNRRKTEFLAVLAHELRNPLAPIRTSLHLVKATDTTGKTSHFTGIIERQVRHMVRLIDDLMDLSRIDTGKLEVRPEPADLVSILRQSVDTARPNVEARNQRLELDLPSAPIRMSLDPVRIGQVFSNLLDNASKFAGAGGEIGLALEHGSEAVRIRVRDNGRGIPPEQLKSIFEPFFQVDRSVDRPTYGLGVGLSLVKRLVELHGGRIEVTSAGPGQGATFTVCLPASLELGEAPSDAAPAQPEPAPSLVVVVVDDNEDAALTLSRALQLCGHDVRTAFSGEAALLMMRERPPDAALVDIGMPGINGYQVAQAVRGESWGADVLLVAVTGWGAKEDKDKARAAGFDHHATKPLDFGELTRLLAHQRVVASGSGAQ